MISEEMLNDQLSAVEQTDAVVQNDPTAVVVLIGNEILSGRTQDTNLSFIAKHLKDQGIHLKHVRVISDDEEEIIHHINELRRQYTYVFTTGGIGATHDDITAACISKAFGVELVEHPEALLRLQQHYGDKLNDNRRRMALMPKGSFLIDNIVSNAPGFAIANVFCLAGMPKVMQAMFLAILPTLSKGEPILSRSLTCDLLEGDIAHLLAGIQREFKDVSIGSYPFYKLPPDVGVTFVVQGQDEVRVTQAFEAVQDMVKAQGSVIFSIDS